MRKDRKYLTFIQPLKFHSAQMKLDSKDIVLTKKSNIGELFSVINHAADFTSSKQIARKILSLKEQYLAQRAGGAYIASVCQSEVFFNFFGLLKQWNFR